MRVSRDTYSSSKPVVKPADIAPATHAVLTVEDVDEVTFDEDRKRLVLNFAEFPGHNYFPNVTSIDALIEALGDETDSWKGKRVPLHVVQTQNPQTKKTQPVLWVVPSNEWDQHLGRRGGTRSAASRQPARKTVAKKGRR